jgi:K+-transporting ATPase ATPase C chain
VARSCKLPAERVLALIDAQTEKPLFGWFGEARVNALGLNLAVEAFTQKSMIQQD